MQPIVNIDDDDQFIIIEDHGPDDIEILGNSKSPSPVQLTLQDWRLYSPGLISE